MYLLALGTALGGALGYYLSGTNSKDTGSRVSSSVSGFNDTYGTPADFQKAIGELQAAFPAEGVVSTDPDDLEVHGFSDNDYHPGALFVLPVVC